MGCGVFRPDFRLPPPNHAPIVGALSKAAGVTYTLTATTGAFNLTGNAAGLAFGRKLTAVTGTFAMTGNAARLARAYPLVATTATFSMTGNAARLAFGRRLVAATGSFALTGFAAGLRVGWRLTASAGSFAMSGQAANLSYGRRLAAAAGSFALTGNSARLAIARYLRTTSGSFAMTGNVATLTYVSGTVLSSTLTDNFDDNSIDGTKWTVGPFYGGYTSAGTALEQNSRLEVTSSATASTAKGLISANLYKLDRAFISLDNTAGIASTGSTGVYLAAGQDANNCYFAWVLNGDLYAEKWVAGARTFLGTVLSGYNSANARWLRLRWGGPTDDTVYFDTAPSSASNPPASGDWVPRYNTARDAAINLASCRIAFGMNSDGVSGGPVYFDGFNRATSTAAYSLTAATGAFTMTGNAAGLRRGYRLTVSAGTFTLTGNAATFRHAYRLTALTGAFSMAGIDALLTYHANVLAFVRATPPALAAITGAAAPAAATLAPRAAPGLASISAVVSPSAPGGFVRSTAPPLAELN